MFSSTLSGTKGGVRSQKDFLFSTSDGSKEHYTTVAGPGKGAVSRANLMKTIEKPSTFTSKVRIKNLEMSKRLVADLSRPVANGSSHRQ